MTELSKEMYVAELMANKYRLDNQYVEYTGRMVNLAELVLYKLIARATKQAWGPDELAGASAIRMIPKARSEGKPLSRATQRMVRMIGMDLGTCDPEEIVDIAVDFDLVPSFEDWHWLKTKEI